MTTPPRALLTHWAAELGCPEAYLAQPGTYLVRSSQLALNRLVVTRTELASVLQVSTMLEDRQEKGALLGGDGPLASEPLTAEQLIARLSQPPLSMAWTEAIFCAPAGAVGKAATAATAQSSRHGPASPLARELRGHDAARLRAVIDAAGEREAFLSGIAGTQPPLFGSFEGDALCAVAGCQPRRGGVVGVRVLTAPQYRLRGHGAAAVSAAIVGGLKRDEYALLSVAYGNRPAMRLCQRLGMDQVAVEEGMELVA